jgi:hypothetical protein
MPQHVYLLVELTIHEGQFDSFEKTAKQMIADTPGSLALWATNGT